MAEGAEEVEQGRLQDSQAGKSDRRDTVYSTRMGAKRYT